MYVLFLSQHWVTSAMLYVAVTISIIYSTYEILLLVVDLGNIETAQDTTLLPGQSLFMCHIGDGVANLTGNKFIPSRKEQQGKRQKFKKS